MARKVEIKSMITGVIFLGDCTCRVCMDTRHLRTFALIVYAHPYCARNPCRNAMLRHARARAQRKKSIHMKGW